MTTPAADHSPPAALLLLATGCPHCAAVLAGLLPLIEEGAIGTLEVVNVAVHPERAQVLGVRTVPWLRLGPFVLEGSHTPAELRRWAEGADSLDGMAAYFHQLLTTGRRAQVEAMARQQPSRLRALAHLLADAETSMSVRLGIGAVLEELHGSGISEALIPDLAGLTQHADLLTRADACHFLSLIGGKDVIPALTACLDDQNGEVREIARESLDELSGSA